MFAKFFLLISAIVTFSSCTSHRETYTVIFDRVDGIQKGSLVLNKGITIGEVTYLDLFENKVVVKIKLKDNIAVPEESKFFITNNILGSSYIDVEFSDRAGFLNSKDSITGSFQQKALMDELISDTIKRKKIEQSLEKIATGIGELVESVKDSAKK